MTKLRRIPCAVLLGAGAMLASPCAAQPVERVDPQYEALMEKISQRPKPEGKLPLESPFIDEDGQQRRLAEFFDGEHPVILSLVYFSCPMMCGLVTEGLTEAMRGMDWRVGEEYTVLTISFDPRDTPGDARAARENQIQRLASGAAEGWHFLTTPDPKVARAIADSVGFGYEWVEEKQQYVHPSVVHILTPDGRLSRYHEDIRFDPDDIKYSLMEAARGKIGNVWERLSFHCVSWDPELGRWVPAAMRIAQIGGAMTILSLVLVVVFAQRARRRARGRSKKLHEPSGQQS